MTDLELASVEELITELEKRAHGLALFISVMQDGGAGTKVNVFDRVKGDPFAVIGYVRVLDHTARIFLARNLNREPPPC